MQTEQQAMERRSSTEENALSTTQEFSTELAPTAGAAEKQFEIQSAIIIAKRFPRDEDAAFQKLMKACGRSAFAEDAEYSFPRGKVQNANGQWVDNFVTGPSVALAREAARVWGNIRHGVTIIRDDANSRQIQLWAWDVETNTKVTTEDDFRKLIYRKNKGWIEPDERDLRELTNRRAAIGKRNCILELLPKDLIEDALAACHKTLLSDVAKDPDAARKKILIAFSELNVTAEMLAARLGHPVAQSSPAEIADLRAVYKSISDGNTTWGDYVNGNSDASAADLKQKTEAKAAELKAKLKPEAKAEPQADILEFNPLGEVSGDYPPQKDVKKIAALCSMLSIDPDETAAKFFKMPDLKVDDLGQEAARRLIADLKARTEAA